jgi:hypothetical protein
MMGSTSATTEDVNKAAAAASTLSALILLFLMAYDPKVEFKYGYVNVVIARPAREESVLLRGWWVQGSTRRLRRQR